MANISLKALLEAEDFQARSKQTGKLVHFKSKDSYQAALKAGTHEDPNAKKGGTSKGAAKSNDMFGGDYAKDRGAEAPKDDSNWMDDLDSIDVSDIKGKADPNADSFTSGDLYGATFKDPQTGKTITVGDAYEREDDSPAYQKAFAYVSKFDPDKEAVMGTQAYDDLNKKEARKGNPNVNKEAKKKAEEFGITPQKLGKEGYVKAMYQAAVEALTDSNFHDEARELISKIEGKPEWAKRVDYPSMDDPKYKEKMAYLRKNGVDSSEYWGGEDNTHEFARKVASSSGWDGVDAADGIAFTLRMNGFHKEANMIQSVFDDKPYMREQTITKKTNENKMKHISLKALLEAEDFQARSKQTGKLVHFKSKDAYQAALKAGSHEDPKAKKDDEPKASAKPNDMFGGDYAKDRGGEDPTTQTQPSAKSKYDDKSYWKDKKRKRGGQGADDNWDDDDSWGEGPQLTSDRLDKIETALEDELDIRGNGFTTSRESGGGMGGWEGPMQIMDKNADFDDEDNYITLSVGSPNNDGKMSIVFANQNGEPYFEPDYDALTGDNDLEPQQAHKITKALMKMPEVQKLLKGEMSKEEFQPIYDKLKAKFSKGKTESTKLTSMFRK
jgi:hypothetical protein